jgi:ParB/RepB/Spo0J family partition protein
MTTPPPTAAVPDIPLDQIHLAEQPREGFDEARMAELVASLKNVGQLAPVRVRARPAGGFDLVFGERRYRAAKRLGWTTIRAEVAAGDPSPAEVLQERLAENLFRDNFKPVERARGFRQLMELKGWTAKQLASSLALSEATVSQALRLLDLHPDLQAAIDAGRVTAAAGYDLSKRTEGEQQEAARHASKGSSARAGTKAAKRPPLTLSLAGKYFDFDVVGNRVTIRGKQIDSVRLLSDALAELAAAARAHLRSTESAAAAAQSPPQAPAPHPKPSGPDGRASA